MMGKLKSIPRGKNWKPCVSEKAEVDDEKAGHSLLAVIPEMAPSSI